MNKHSRPAIRPPAGDRIFNIFNMGFMILFLIIIAYPLYYCLILSLNNGVDATRGGLWLYPRVLTLENYISVLSEGMVIRAFLITLARASLGTVLSLILNSFLSYGLVKRDLMFRRFYMTICIVTMFFSGGIIPMYLLIKQLGLLDNFLVYIFPMLSGFSTILLYMAFFREIPASLIESAKIDGAHEYQILTRVIIPLSAPLLATMALFSAVAHWNSWYDGYIYISNRNLMTLSSYLVNLLNRAEAEDLLRRTGKAGISGTGTGTTSESLKVATMFVSILPIMCVYPFLQRFFVKGIMIGAVKG